MEFLVQYMYSEIDGLQRHSSHVKELSPFMVNLSFPV